MSYEQPAPVSEIGNITLHGREGIVIEFGYQDNTGADVNISATSLYFEVKGVLRTALTAGATNYRKNLTITEAHTAAIYAAGGKNGRTLPFALRNESADPIPVLWQGNITVTGFTEQPA